ncbi:MAG: hypothetical protein WA987_03155 [Cellvibrio sp.]|jgi:hypothetical protein
MSRITDIENDPTIRKASGAAQEAAGALASKFSGTEEKLRQVAADTAQCLAESQQKARDQARKSMQYIRVTSRKNPLLVAGVAFAVGLLAAALFRRDHD